MPDVKTEGAPVLSAKDERALDRANDRIGREDGVPPPVNFIAEKDLRGYLTRIESGTLKASKHWIATLKKRIASL